MHQAALPHLIREKTDTIIKQYLLPKCGSTEAHQPPRIVIRWMLAYGCSESYYSYMMKLKQLAELFAFGKDSQKQFQEILERKPIARTYYPYDKREWDKLG